MILTILIIAITAIVSIMAFNNADLLNKFIFYPPAVARKEYFRFFTYGFVHADWNHLIFNMITLFFFGPAIESTFKEFFGSTLGALLYMLLYLLALIVSIFPTFMKNRHNASYRSLGASGAVSAVVFAYMLIAPTSYMGLFFIPISIPAYLFGILYIFISLYLDKKQTGNINHSAHITGAVFGLAFTLFSFYVIGNYNLIQYFWESIQSNGVKDLIRFGY